MKADKRNSFCASVPYHTKLKTNITKLKNTPKNNYVYTLCYVLKLCFKSKPNQKFKNLKVFELVYGFLGVSKLS